MDADWTENLLVALNLRSGLSRDAACRLAHSPSDWLHTDPADARATARNLGVKPKHLRAALKCSQDPMSVAEKERRRAESHGATILTRASPDYPAALFDLELPPPVLYVRGKLRNAPSVSIVGSRRTDPYGIEVAEKFAGALAAAGLTIVSGLALGIDSAAHKGCLQNGGETIAVLGCGIDIDYPRSNRRLVAKIADSGCIVSEFPIGARPEAWHFPVRNRIIAALGSGTLVVRGTPRSGSLITAGCALALGRLIWAIPGNIFDPRSKGPNSLIRDGAHPVQTPDELLETLPLAVQADLLAADTPEREPPRADLANLLQQMPRGEALDQGALLASTDVGIERLLGMLMELEIAGYIRRYPGPTWGRTGLDSNP